LIQKIHNATGSTPKAQVLEEQSNFPLSEEQQKIFEELDNLCCAAVEKAERQCRKCHMGQVAFSPTIKLCMLLIKAWSLLLKRAKGGKVSSRFLDRTLAKARLSSKEKTMGATY
jgi:hypothetical protein